MILKDRGDLSVALLDVAFDTVSHEWMQNILTIYKVSSNIRRLISTLMQNWRVQLTQKGKARSADIKIVSG